MVLNGTLIETERVAAHPREHEGEEMDTRYSGKHRVFGVTRGAEPGSTNDIVAARKHCPPALYKAAVDALPTLADFGYQGAGIGIHHPCRISPTAGGCAPTRPSRPPAARLRTTPNSARTRS